MSVHTSQHDDRRCPTLSTDKARPIAAVNGIEWEKEYLFIVICSFWGYPPAVVHHIVPVPVFDMLLQYRTALMNCVIVKFQNMQAVNFSFLLHKAVSEKKLKLHKTIMFLVVTLPNIHRFWFFFTRRFSHKLFLIWLSITPPHLNYVTTLPCNLSLIACFADINAS